jgi:N-acetylneuraminic acid mutarotase
VKRALSTISIFIAVLVIDSCFGTTLCTWQAEPPMGTGRDQFAGGVINGKIYVFGGNGNPDATNLKSTEVYDPATGLWTQLADNNHNGGNGVEELTSAVVNGKLYVFGAWGGGNGDINFNEVYDPVGNTWTTLASKPTLVTAAVCTVYNGEIFLFGGRYYHTGVPNVYYTVVEAYNPATNTWRFVTNKPRITAAPAIATVGTKAYLFGGGDPNSGLFLNDVVSYDFQTGVWTTSGYAALPTAKNFIFSSAVPVLNGKVYLIGGMDRYISGKKYYSLTVDIYDPSANSWARCSSLPLPLQDYLAVGIGGKIYVLGGDNDYTFINRSKTEVISLSTPCLTPSIADFNADGIVNLADFATFASSWLMQNTPQ